jgi:hypothetical protein
MTLARQRTVSVVAAPFVIYEPAYFGLARIIILIEKQKDLSQN